jgi:hypothetical protein
MSLFGVCCEVKLLRKGRKISELVREAVEEYLKV